MTNSFAGQQFKRAIAAPAAGTPTPPTIFAVFHRQIVKNPLVELRPFPSPFSPDPVRRSKKQTWAVNLCNCGAQKQAPKASVSTRSGWPLCDFR